MITEPQKKMYFIPCKKVTILSAVANNYAEAVKEVLKEHPLVCEYKVEDDNFGEWIKVGEPQ